jgi:hypothetical protein
MGSGSTQRAAFTLLLDAAQNVTQIQSDTSHNESVAKHAADRCCWLTLIYFALHNKTNYSYPEATYTYIIQEHIMLMAARTIYHAAIYDAAEQYFVQVRG